MSAEMDTANFTHLGLGAMALGSRQMMQVARAGERLCLGFAEIAAGQFAFAGRLVEAGVDDFNTLAAARSPEALLHAEMDVLRRQSDRATELMIRFDREWRAVWGEAVEVIQSFGAALPPCGGGRSH